MDKGNIEKNKQHNIPSPVPIRSFQDLISGIITPKISALTQTFGSLSSGLLGGVGGASSGGGGLGGIASLSSGSSGSSSGGSNSGGSSDDDFGDDAGGAPAQAANPLGGIVSSVLRLSGPILSASLGGGAGSSGGLGGLGGSTATTEADDDDF